MKISDLFRRLSYGELSNLAISAEGSGTLVETKHAQIIQYANEGLLRLFSRFNLREKHLLIEQVAHITNYHLKVEYVERANVLTPVLPLAEPAEFPPLVQFKYIKDRVDDPFEEDVIRILEVHDSLGNKFVLNDHGRPESLFTPQPDVLQVPNPVVGQALGIKYQARHPILRHEALNEDDDIQDQEIELPFYLEGALQAFIGSKVYSHMATQESLIKSQEYSRTFELICLETEQKDLVNQTFSTSHNKFYQRGFV
jgi:hypothetical protein